MRLLDLVTHIARIIGEMGLERLKELEITNRMALYKDLFAHDITNILQGILSANQRFPPVAAAPSPRRWV